ncbi:unnamed protein product [Dovyalis caffra]|uniref:Ribonuclease H1 N-terminal domain-containing protein n=1 Tax=Dovyalis caffra TaxID=77055 RepID=A0AAV1RHY8_9ROSI|nr:unnamed protein product [Dovyalis caffra]
MARNKAYVVFRGRALGVYLSREDCEAQMIGFLGALYRGFKNHFEAKESYVRFFYSDHPYGFVAHMSTLQQQVHGTLETYENVIISTKANTICTKVSGKLECKIIIFYFFRDNIE